METVIKIFSREVDHLFVIKPKKVKLEKQENAMETVIEIFSREVDDLFIINQKK